MRGAAAAVVSGYRPIRAGDAYDKYIPAPEVRDRVIIEDGAVEDTVELMRQVVWKYLGDTRRLAPVLRGNSLRQTCSRLWNFLYHHIQYRQDERGLEQLRRPARSWADRRSGIDCDCFSIFCSSVLTNLGIAHSFRIVKYGGPNYQHVYVVVPAEDGEELIIDAVLSRFDYEKAYTQKKDFAMSLTGIDVAVLSGHEQRGGSELWGSLPGGQTGTEDMYRYLVATRQAAASQPAVTGAYGASFVAMLDYALRYWDTPQRDEALAVLARNEEALNAQLSGLGSTKQTFFQKLGDLVKKAGSGVASAAKSVAQVVVKVNPVSVVARQGFLAALRLNLRRMSSRLKWGYASQSEAAAKGVSAADWQKARTALTRIEVLFADKLQGKRENLREAILEGRAGGLSGEDGLGEPVTMAAAIAAAAPLIAAALKILQEAGLMQAGERTDTTDLVAEAEQAAKSGAELPQYAPADPVRPALLPTTTQQQTMLPATGTEGSPGGITGMIRNNPVLALAGAGAVAYAAYALLSPKKGGRKKGRGGGLAGTGGRRRPAGGRSRSSAAAGRTGRRRAGSKGRGVQRLFLK